jgi:hypothetical protein
MEISFQRAIFGWYRTSGVAKMAAGDVCDRRECLRYPNVIEKAAASEETATIAQVAQLGFVVFD